MIFFNKQTMSFIIKPWEAPVELQLLTNVEIFVMNLDTLHRLTVNCRQYQEQAIIHAIGLNVELS